MVVGRSARGVSRRAVLGGAIAATAIGRARATIIDLVAVGKDGWLFPIWDEVRHTDLKAVAKVAQTMNAGVDILKKANIQVVIALTPENSRIYREYLPDDFKFVPDADHRYAVALEELRKSGALVPDLYPALAALRTSQTADTVFFKGDTHWTALGAETGATEIAKQMMAPGKLKLPASTQPGTKFSGVGTLTQEKNDLADLLPPAQRGQYPLEPYHIHQAAGGGLIDDEAADVVVIGNSFMQPVTLVWKIHQYGPYEEMLSYFTSDSFRRKRASVVVWNFHETDMTLPSDKKDGWGANAMAPDAFLSSLRQAVGVA